ncbi:MAG: hypothetical protein AAB574_02665 [Patescibacteria group bacterium]
MLKEFILAIIFGSLIGFGASSAIVTINQKKSPVSVSSPTSIPTPISSTANLTSTPTLSIETPKNESFVSTANITLKGNSPGNSFILVSTAKDSYQATADNSGSFSLDLSLSLGANILKIKSISPDNSENNLELLVTYSTAKLE